MINSKLARKARKGEAPPPFLWRRVARPRPWYPNKEGQCLIGWFAGTKPKSGPYGYYQEGIVHDLDGRPRKVSGSILMSYLDAVQVGEKIKIRYLGQTTTRRGYFAHDYEVYREDVRA